MPVKNKFDFDSIRSKSLKAIFKTPYIYPELLFTLFQMAHCKIIVPVTTSSVSLFRVVTETWLNDLIIYKDFFKESILKH